MESEEQHGHSFGVLHAKNRQVVAMSSNSSDVLTSWDDMIAVNMPKATMMSAYEKKFGTRPDDVHLNDDFCKNNGWLSYNYLGNVSYYNVAIKPMSKVDADRILENNTDKAFTQTITLSTTATNSATATVTSTSSISVSDTITVGSEAYGIEDEFSASFTLSNEVGKSSTQSTANTISDSVTVTVEPHTKIRVYLQVEWESRTQDWDIPVKIDRRGLTAANFPKRVGEGGHYHWAVSHGTFFAHPFMSKIRGTLTSSYNTRGNMKVDPATSV